MTPLIGFVEPSVAPDSDFATLVGVRNAVEAHTLGTDLLAQTPAQLVPLLSDNPHRHYRHLAAWVDDVMVGRALFVLPRDAESIQARGIVDVLPEFRGRGVGEALLLELERLAAAANRTVLQVDVVHTVDPVAEQLVAAIGVGSVPIDDPGVRFLQRHGYSLEQVERVSRFDLRGAELPGDRGLAVGYEAITWAGTTPPEWLADVARLKTVMSTAPPSGALTVTETSWSADDVRDRDARQVDRGRELVTTVAREIATNRLVGITEIELGADGQAAYQEDTLVVPEHRGHRLGLDLKLANLHAVRRAAPATDTILTFNAEDNRPMLDVNEALGFRPIGYGGYWQKRRE